MIPEYGLCEGEKIVSEQIKPEKTSFLWSKSDVKLPTQFLSNQIVNKFKNIENKSGFPQDIKWGIKGNQFY